MALNPTIASWRGQRVWLIGASYGIGAAIARELINAGALVALSARRRDLLDEIARDTDALVVPLDVVDAASVRAAAAQIAGKWRGFDLALIIAGTHVEMRAENWDLARARQLLDVNLFGVLNCLDSILPALMRQ